MNQKSKFNKRLVLLAVIIIAVFVTIELIVSKTVQAGIIEEIIKGNVSPKPYERINIIGKNTKNASKGVFDPSLEHDDNGVIWMVYTAIEMENKGNAHFTDLAKSEDGGKTWRYVARIIDSPMGEVTLKGKKIFGNWRNEVATLVDDKNDPDPSKRWKLFWHKYFMKPPFGENDRVLPYFGWIAYKYAASPEGLAKAGEIRLFGNYPFPFNPQNGEPGYPVIHYLDRIDKNLKGFLSFTEPGFLAKDGMLYLSIEGIPSDFDKRTIFLISSKDNGNTWQYNGVLLNKKDANDFNTPIFTASSLFEENGKVFLLASPVTPKGHNGILVFEFENAAKAKLKRDDSGKLILVKRIEPYIEGAFSGAGDYDAKKTYGGIIMSAADVLKIIEKKSKEGGVQIFDTKERIREKLIEKKRGETDKKGTEPGLGGIDARCGNDICEVGENNVNCRQDCGINSPPYHPEKYDSIEVGGIKRTYMLYVPPCYKKGTPIPLVMNFHGGGGTGEAAEIGSGGMNRKAAEVCFIAVYPNGVSATGQPGKRQHWNTGKRAEFRNQNIDDVAFVSAMLDKLEKEYSIDKNRIYATGISNGGMMSYRLACELSDRIAAIAPVGAGMVLENCQPKRPISIIHFHGTADPGWPYEGGSGCFTKDNFEPVSVTISKWVALNGCQGSPKITFQNGKTACKTYGPCQENAGITLCAIEEGGHTWPGGYAFPVEQLVRWDSDCGLGQGRGMGKITQDISALDAMWEFFKRHHKE